MPKRSEPASRQKVSPSAVFLWIPDALVSSTQGQIWPHPARRITQSIKYMNYAPCADQLAPPRLRIDPRGTKARSAGLSRLEGSSQPQESLTLLASAFRLQTLGGATSLEGSRPNAIQQRPGSSACALLLSDLFSSALLEEEINTELDHHRKRSPTCDLRL